MKKSHIGMSFDFLCARRSAVPLKEEELEYAKGKVVVITGANSGIGKAFAIEMAKREAIVILACRDEERGKEALDDIKSLSNSKTVELYQIDLGDFKSIHNFVSTLKLKHSKIDILMNNAGLIDPTPKLMFTNDGFEEHFGVNHLGPFFLTQLLLPLLENGAPSRIVMVASSMHMLANLRLDNLNFEKDASKGFAGDLPYSNSKLANVYFAKELGKRLEGKGVTTYALCPGLVKTNVFRQYGYLKSLMNTCVLAIAGIEAEKATQILLYCSLNKSIANETGKMYRLGHEWKEATEALDDDFSVKLYEASEKLIEKAGGFGDRK